MIPSPSRKLKSKVRLVRRHLRELETQLLALDDNNKNLMSLRRAEINLMSLEKDIDRMINMAFNLYNEKKNEDS